MRGASIPSPAKALRCHSSVRGWRLPSTATSSVAQTNIPQLSSPISDPVAKFFLPYSHCVSIHPLQKRSLAMEPMQQGRFGTCVAYAFAQVLANSLLLKYGVAVSPAALVEVGE